MRTSIILIILLTPVFTPLFLDANLFFLAYTDEMILVTGIFLLSLSILLRPIIKSYPFIGIVSFLVFFHFFLGVINHVAIEAVLAQLRYFIQGLLFFLIIRWMSVSIKDLERTLKIYTYIGILILVAGFFQYIFNINYFSSADIASVAKQNFVRISSLIGNPIDLGNYLAVVMITIAFGAVSMTHGARIFLTGIFLLGIILTGSRGVLAALLLSYLCYIFFYKKQLKKGVVIIPILAVCLGGLFLAEASVIMRFFEHSLVNSDEQGRFMFMLKGLELFVEDPIFGVGPGMFGGPVANMFANDLYESIGLLVGYSSIDSYWMHIIVEMGVIGTLLILFMYYQIYRYISFMRVYVGPVSDATVMILFHMLISSAFFIGMESQIYFYMFWFMVSYVYLSSKAVISQQYNNFSKLELSSSYVSR